MRPVLPRHSLLAVLLGFAPGAALGIGRFAYGLVLPGMQSDLGLSYAQAGLLGSANTGGYLLGALISHRVLYAVGYRRGFYGALLLQTLALLLLATSDDFLLLFALRSLQGVLGASVFVGGAALLLASGGRGLATGIYFGGVGLGIVLSPLVLPFISSWQLAWVLLAALSLLMSAVAFIPWRRLEEPVAHSADMPTSLRPIAALLLCYGLYGAGYIGYMTFVTTGLNIPIMAFWMVLGVGALLNGWLWGRWTEKVGGPRALVHVLIVLSVASLYPLVIYAPWLSAFAFGLSFLGVITAITQVFSRLLPPAGWARAMGISTACFATGQAIGPGLSGLAGDIAGGPAGALGLSSALLLLALVVALAERTWGQPLHTSEE